MTNSTGHFIPLYSFVSGSNKEERTSFKVDGGAVLFSSYYEPKKIK
jgi:hypothetical protein